MSRARRNVTLGVDIGGTNMRIAAVEENGTIADMKAVPTPKTEHALERGIRDLVQDFQHTYDVDAVGLAVAGFLDPDCEVVRFAPHLPWRDRNVRALLEDVLDLPVRLEHDANSAAWGEYRFGAAQGSDNWVLFALGTGIGATLMVDGEIYRGAFGTAPEFGHLTVIRGGRECPCGKRGCLERYCSGTALVDTAHEFLASRPEVASCLRGTAELTGTHIAECARKGDPLALDVFADFAQWLGTGLSMVADVLDPRQIVIAGGVSRAHNLYLDAAVEEMKSSMVGGQHRPIPAVSCAELGGDAGMIGVADLARITARGA